MSFNNKITVNGWLVADAESKFLPNSGTHVVELVIYDNDSRYNQDTRSYENHGSPTRFRVSSFNEKVNRTASELRKGTPVIVQGSMVESVVRDAGGAITNSYWHLRADTIAIDLRHATVSDVSPIRREQQGEYQQQAQGGYQQAQGGYQQQQQGGYQQAQPQGGYQPQAQQQAPQQAQGGYQQPQGGYQPQAQQQAQSLTEDQLGDAPF